jgi:hypothetical protein
VARRGSASFVLMFSRAHCALGAEKVTGHTCTHLRASRLTPCLQIEVRTITHLYRMATWHVTYPYSYTVAPGVRAASARHLSSNRILYACPHAYAAVSGVCVPDCIPVGVPIPTPLPPEPLLPLVPHAQPCRCDVA